MSTVIFKVKYGDILRRISLIRPSSSRDTMRFSDLKQIVRQAFNIPIATEFAIVYTDDENEMVTMADDFDIGDAFFHQTQNPVRAIVVPQGELQCSAQDARPPEQLTSDPPPWAADIILKLDKLLLLAANKQLIMEPGVEPVRSISTKTEDHLLGVNDSPVHDSRIESAKDGSSEGGWLDIAQSGIDSETILRRAAILRQRRILTESSD